MIRKMGSVPGPTCGLTAAPRKKQLSQELATVVDR
jgi:hypothetical protein